MKRPQQVPRDRTPNFTHLLLIALPGERVAVLEATFAARGLDLWRVGRVVEGAGVLLA